MGWWPEGVGAAAHSACRDCQNMAGVYHPGLGSNFSVPVHAHERKKNQF